jgi:hypothetical protein
MHGSLAALVLAIVTTTPMLACNTPDPDAPATGDRSGSPTGAELEREADPVLARLQKAAGATRRSEAVHRARLTRGAFRDYQLVLHGGACYKVLATGGDGVSNLDLLLFDPDGVLRDRDTGQDPNPSLGLTHPICPEVAGLYRLRARVMDGEGDIVVAVYR